MTKTPSQRMRWIFTLALFLFATLGHAVPGPDPITGDLNTTIHDPTICKDNSGKYFLFSTMAGLDIRTSTDRKDWTFVGKVWPDGAPWTDPFTNTSNGVLWAPDCTYVDGQFVLYYAASTSGSQHSAIFLAKSSTGLPGSWTHEGMVTSTTKANDYNAIDPNTKLTDGNKRLLSLGSFWTGIKSVNINPSTGLLSDQNVTSLAQRTADNGAMEASCVFKFNNFYYLFTSWDHCCSGASSDYNIRVGRSTSPTGGFVDQAGVTLLNGGGTLVLGTHDSIIGPGGQDLIIDNDGPIMVYHYWTPAGDIQHLGINRLDFSSGWPAVV
ncbi:glycoside hydrolase family 43 protein [Macrolepiota fuliginosa MF-IS2]|uniref:Arabinan endo-1,5-alpha-L-arabinosidase n=1 Tax=Macrolepiota fuliginosa MF-IS2 TaxID=1400762 RepID=A0A9P6BXU3_9AGAR|nr:glycoside hydrolase family 43 protein [Macrolepiota fuliginosa MF-IS2]